MPEQPQKKPERKLVPKAPQRAEHQPWVPEPVSPEDLGAVRAVYHGTALEHQQRRAMEFIIKQLCGIGRIAFIPGPDGARATDLALGKQMVGIELVNIVQAKTQTRGEQ